jgi:hypothetical protein
LAAVLLGMSAHTAAASAAAGTGGNPGGSSKHSYRVLNLLPIGDGFVSTRWRAARFGKLLHTTVGERPSCASGCPPAAAW